MLEEFDGSTTVPRLLPYRVPAWIQIHKIPHLYHIQAILKQLASRVGKLVAVDLKACLSSSGEFHRARVELEASKPLVRFVTLSPEGCESMFLLVKYETLLHYCKHCSLVGHVHVECGNDEYQEEDLQFREWMLASEDT